MLDFKRHINILDFDIETRPLTYWADRPSAEITAIAWCWAHDFNTMDVTLLGVDEPVAMLERFTQVYNQADMVTGHYIRKFDLPQINGALMEYGLPQLGPKLTCDTRLDLHKKGDIPATQEYLGELLDLPAQKVVMSQVKWRAANRLTPEGIAGAKKRVTGDVLEHMFLRIEMLERGLLSSPKLWKP